MSSKTGFMNSFQGRFIAYSLFILAIIVLYSSQEWRANFGRLQSILPKNHFPMSEQGFKISGLTKNNELFLVIKFYKERKAEQGARINQRLPLAGKTTEKKPAMISRRRRLSYKKVGLIHNAPQSDSSI